MYPKNTGPPTHGANEDVPVREAETYQGFLQQQQLKAEKLYNRRIARMKQLGLIEQSNPGNIQQVYSEQFGRIGGWWSDFWKTLTGWIEDIDKWVGPLIDLYKELEEAGIITPAQRDKAEAEGWTKEQLVSLIRAQMAPAWERYLPWITVGGLGIGLVLVLALRK